MQYYYIDNVDNYGKEYQFDTKKNKDGYSKRFLLATNNETIKVYGSRSIMPQLEESVFKEEVEFIFPLYYQKYDKIFQELEIIYCYTDLPYE
jgi:hypothetical protein